MVAEEAKHAASDCPRTPLRNLLHLTMPKRRRTAFVPKKKATKTYKLVGGDPDAPTEAEWKTLVEFGSFVGQSISNL